MIYVEARYHTFTELLQRWKIPSGSYDVHRLVMENILKPCILVAVELAPMRRLPEGGLVRDDAIEGSAQGWRYPVHDYWRQTAAFEATYPIVSDLCAPSPDRKFWELQTPIALTDVLSHGVVMAADLAECELQVKRSQEATTKERNSTLSLLSTILADYCRYDPNKPDNVHAQLSASARKYGNPLSENTIRKYARLAMSEYPPSYLLATRPPTEGAPPLVRDAEVAEKEAELN